MLGWILDIFARKLAATAHQPKNPNLPGSIFPILYALYHLRIYRCLTNMGRKSTWTRCLSSFWELTRPETFSYVRPWCQFSWIQLQPRRWRFYVFHPCNACRDSAWWWDLQGVIWMRGKLVMRLFFSGWREHTFWS